MAIFSMGFMLSYPLKPYQISLISMFTIGIPAFLLAMEPNKKMIHGNFLSNVLLKALPAGNPVCEAGLAMHKDGKTADNGRTRQKYCCPFRQSKTGVCPCSHKNWNNGKKNRGCTKYKTIPNDYRLSIDRSCLCFKRTYALRTECERYNSRFKSTGQERLWVRNGTSAANLNTLAHISALAVALAAVLHGYHSYRSAKQLRRSA